MTRTRMDSHQWDTAIDPATVPLFLQLHWAQARALAAMQPLLVAHGLSAAEFDVLATLRNAPAPHELTPSAIQAEVVITSGGLTKVMLQLEARELVARTVSADDQRVKPVRLTAKGKRTVEKAMKEVVAATGAWLRESLSAGEIATLTRLLGKLAEPDAG